jgi:hypothetical protein
VGRPLSSDHPPVAQRVDGVRAVRRTTTWRSAG